jgi:hypothetical protein
MQSEQLMEVFAKHPPVQKRPQKRICYQLKNYQNAGQKYSRSLQTSELLDNLVLRRQNVTGRIMKMCATWRLKEESK